MAVTWFGRYVENKLNDYDKNGKPRYKLDDLLSDEPLKAVNGFDAFAAALGAFK